ncbi:hypothetical protein JXA40_11775 [bacterium]|nr:hypothetical protein [candidate division CSSED10-310 bacterium]
MKTSGKPFAIVLLVGGIICASGIGFFIWRDSRSGTGPENLTLFLISGLAAVVFSAAGAHILLGFRKTDRKDFKPDYRHAFPPLGLIGIVLLAALIARDLSVPETFGQYGRYRGAAIGEATQFEIRHREMTVCRDCHDEIVRMVQKDLHTYLECFVCHGPAGGHADDPESVVPPVPRSNDICLLCHMLLAARPGHFPQIELDEHFRSAGVKDRNIRCIQCHSPHEPLFMDRDIREARMHPMIHRCRDCHIDMTDETRPKPSDHPVIFECSYCHAGTVRDFYGRPHAQVKCTTCHLFTRINEFSGRIIRDADPRFCLLCHRDADYRGPESPPGIDWPEHLADAGADPKEMNLKCIDCHSDALHGDLSDE